VKPGQRRGVKGVGPTVFVKTSSASLSRPLCLSFDARSHNAATCSLRDTHCCAAAHSPGGRAPGLARQLIAWRPTKLVIEWLATRQTSLDSTYAAYRAGGEALRQMQGDPDELYQLTLPLAQALGLERIHAVDTPNPQIVTSLNDSIHEARYEAQAIPGFDKWNARYDTLSALRDTMRARSSLVDYLLHLNSDEVQARAVGRWLVATKRGTNTEPVGADGFITRYFLRNARIFSNVQRIIDNPNDRVLILYGNTHGYFIRELLRASPEYRLRDARELLAAPTRGAGQRAR
jgi:hypothetical protein